MLIALIHKLLKKKKTNKIRNFWCYEYISSYKTKIFFWWIFRILLQIAVLSDLKYVLKAKKH